jgi:hypothetical protein
MRGHIIPAKPKHFPMPFLSHAHNRKADPANDNARGWPLHQSSLRGGGRYGCTRDLHPLHTTCPALKAGFNAHLLAAGRSKRHGLLPSAINIASIEEKFMPLILPVRHVTSTASAGDCLSPKLACPSSKLSHPQPFVRTSAVLQSTNRMRSYLRALGALLQHMAKVAAYLLSATCSSAIAQHKATVMIRHILSSVIASMHSLCTWLLLVLLLPQSIKAERATHRNETNILVHAPRGAFSFNCDREPGAQPFLLD